MLGKISESSKNDYVEDTQHFLILYILHMGKINEVFSVKILNSQMKILLLCVTQLFCHY